MVLRAVIIEPAQAILTQIGNLLTGLLKIVFILILGWIVARTIKRFVIKILTLVGIEKIAERLKIHELLSKGGIKYSFSELIGVFGYWLIILVSLVVAVNAVGLTVAAELLNRVVLYLPNVLVAIFIVILGLFVSTFLGSLVQTAAGNAGIGQAKLLSKLVEIVIIIFAMAITLEQLNIGAHTVVLAINIILASLGLALALAFGLGCKDIAAKIVSDWLDRIKSKK